MMALSSSSLRFSGERCGHSFKNLKIFYQFSTGTVPPTRTPGYGHRKRKLRFPRVWKGKEYKHHWITYQIWIDDGVLLYSMIKLHIYVHVSIVYKNRYNFTINYQIELELPFRFIIENNQRFKVLSLIIKIIEIKI